MTVEPNFLKVKTAFIYTFFGIHFSDDKNFS